MSIPANEPSQLEREFWERRFDTPPVDVDELPPRSSRRDRRAEFWERRFDAPPGGDVTAPPSGTEPPRRAERASQQFAAEPVWARAIEWLRDRRGDPRLGVVVLVTVAVIAGFAWYRIGIGGDDAGAAPSPPTAATASGAPTPTGGAGTDEQAGSTGGGDASATEDAALLVHVAGAVARPGVVELHGRARVIDAVEAVGGATPEGDLDRLNLAATLDDGARVYVPVRGQADPGVLAPGTAGGPSPAGDGSGPSPGAKLDLNTATQEQLEALPGIGPAYAQAIIAERERRGGFSSVNELREVRGIGDQRFADLAPLVVV